MGPFMLGWVAGGSARASTPLSQPLGMRQEHPRLGARGGVPAGCRLAAAYSLEEGGLRACQRVGVLADAARKRPEQEVQCSVRGYRGGAGLVRRYLRPALRGALASASSSRGRRELHWLLLPQGCAKCIDSRF
jgi:hypothetical protein